MPPKAKFSKEEITKAALTIVREEGVDSLTSRALGAKLGSSARPIFTVFQNMEEVQQSVIEEVKKRYKEYVQKGLSQKPAFKGVGMQYILFAINEPKLFRLLFMNEHKQIPDLTDVLPLIDDNYEQIISSIQRDFGIDSVSAVKLYRHLWIYTHGIAMLCATNMCRFTGEEISKMMTEVCVSLLKNMGVRKHDD